MPQFPLNTDAVDELLEEGVAREDAPPGYAAVVELLDAARREAATLEPPDWGELLGKIPVVLSAGKRAVPPELTIEYPDQSDSPGHDPP